ncbi:MAG: cation transporter [Chloroflexi bacterium]|nr:cation transporter [Chloroflexota bacterium]
MRTRRGTIAPINSETQRLASSRKSLRIAFAMIAGYAGVEVAGGLLSNSLALLADAGHMVTDVASLGMALMALWIAGRPISSRQTYGFQRAEVIAALANALGLWAVAGWIFYEAYHRFTSPPEVQGALMLVVGFVGLGVNIGAALALKGSAQSSLNVQGAFLHVLGDLLGSIGVVAASLLVLLFDWYVADPIFGMVIGVLVLASSAHLVWRVLRVLMQGTPAGLDAGALCARLERVEGVTGVHDLHVWSLTNGYDVFSAHVLADVAGKEDAERLLRKLREVAADEFGIAHATIQLEDTPSRCVEQHHVNHVQHA